MVISVDPVFLFSHTYAKLMHHYISRRLCERPHTSSKPVYNTHFNMIALIINLIAPNKLTVQKVKSSNLLLAYPTQPFFHNCHLPNKMSKTEREHGLVEYYLE